MIITWHNNKYKLGLWWKFFPASLTQLIPTFKGEKKGIDYRETTTQRLKGKTALVTGGHQGIGEAITRILLAEGANVVVAARSETKLLSFKQACNTDRLEIVVWDISNLDVLKKKFDEVESKFGKIDVLVNNAAVMSKSGKNVTIDIIDSEELNYVHDINVISTRQLSMEYVSRYDDGSILNIISNNGLRPCQNVYMLSKWAINSFTGALKDYCEAKGKRINVCGICPGPTRTQMTIRDTIVWSTSNNKRIGLPEEIGELALKMILTKSTCIVSADGGQLLY